MPNRKPIVITGSSAGAQTDYVLPIDLTYDADMETDFGDVYFTLADGVTRLDFWLYDFTVSTSATFYVKIPNIPASPDKTTIYAVYDGSVLDASDINATFISADDFHRTTLNQNSATWTKYGSNPVIANPGTIGIGDPAIIYNAGTWYCFVTDVDNNNIRLFTATSPSGSWTDQGAVLDVGTAGAWDDDTVQDPTVAWDGTQWVMYYSGYDGSGTRTNNNLGRATASTLDGTWTKYGSNPVMTVTNGIYEPHVTYSDNDKWRMTYTYNGTGSGSASGYGYLGHATSTDGITWTDNGGFVTNAQYWQDQFHIWDHDAQLWRIFTNANNVTNQLQSLSSYDFTNFPQPSTGGNIPPGTSGSWEVNVFAPTAVKVGNTWYMFYQGTSASGSQIGYATSSTLTDDKWQQSHASFTISSNRLVKTSGRLTNWAGSRMRIELEPPYVVEANIDINTYAGSGYAYGLWFGVDTSGNNYGVILNPALNAVGLWRTTYPDGAASTVVTSSTSVTIDPGNEYRIRANVTTTGISIDIYNGSWTNNIVSETRSIEYGLAGYFTYNNGTNNQYYSDYIYIRRTVSPEPTYSVGSEETGQLERLPFKIFST